MEFTAYWPEWRWQDHHDKNAHEHHLADLGLRRSARRRTSARLSPRELASIGYVSEDQNLPGWMTVEYFLAYLKPFYPTWDDSLATKMVREFNLPLGRELRHLSHGMRRKTALASSLAYRPRLRAS